MTSRLKRKLVDIGVDPSSARANENFCLSYPLTQIGMHLPPLEKSRDTGEFVSGRRRLHGAFTGGFSAGYFDTTFVSSRSDCAKKNAAKPEDFMDREDLQDIRDIQKIVDTTDEIMDFVTGKQAPLTTAFRSAMLPPTNESVGARILKKMGWRVGQGIDLKASTSTGYLKLFQILLSTRTQRKPINTYAPRDTPMLVVEQRQQSLLSLGFVHLAYDGTDDHDRERSSLGNSKLKSVSLPSRKIRDGTAVLPGFVLSDKPVMEDRYYSINSLTFLRCPLPDIPPRWKPDPERVWSQHQPQEPASSSNKENIKNDAANALPHGKWKTSGLSADARGSILGETPLPSAPRSVFDFMSQKDRERLKNIAASLHPPSAAESSTVAESTSQFSPTPTPTHTTATPRIPRIDPGIARAAINGFKPFATNPVNQARYTAYLQSQADPSSTITPEPLSINQCPNSTLRWTNMLRAISGFRDDPPQDDDAATANKGKEAKAKDEKELSPQENAAQLGIYRPLTREGSWFGVKDPNPEPKTEDPATQPLSSSSFDVSAADHGIVSTTEASRSTSTGEPRDLANVGLGDEDDTQGRDLTYERPSIVILKAIFASDDEDSSDEEAITAAPIVATVTDTQPLAPNTFKPTFGKREARTTKKDSDNQEKLKEKKAKRKRNERLSFLSWTKMMRASH
ncbi:hypothetical protein FB446DRAFT_817640 [Lentinula raphanica]|nr:hypothetical protein FB446DRAFT_817640 [Lentinula raphanica]